MLPGPDKVRIQKADVAYVVSFEYKPENRKTPVRLTKVASDEFELKTILSELYRGG